MRHDVGSGAGLRNELLAPSGIASGIPTRRDGFCPEALSDAGPEPAIGSIPARRASGGIDLEVARAPS